MARSQKLPDRDRKPIARQSARSQQTRLRKCPIADPIARGIGAKTIVKTMLDTTEPQNNPSKTKEIITKLRKHKQHHIINTTSTTSWRRRAGGLKVSIWRCFGANLKGPADRSENLPDRSPIAASKRKWLCFCAEGERENDLGPPTSPHIQMSSLKSSLRRPSMLNHCKIQ